MRLTRWEPFREMDELFKGFGPLFGRMPVARMGQTRFDWAYDYDVPTIGAKKSVLDGIGFVQAIIEQDRLIVDEKCHHTLAMLDQFRWDERPLLQQEKPVHDIHIHIADAVRYAIYSHSVSAGVF